MGCWRWFKGVLKEAGIEVTEENREKIAGIILEVVGETSMYEHCSGDWKKIVKLIKADENEKEKLLKNRKRPYRDSLGSNLASAERKFGC